jgi:hypothetical protein
MGVNDELSMDLTEKKLVNAKKGEQTAFLSPVRTARCSSARCRI